MDEKQPKHARPTRSTVRASYGGKFTTIAAKQGSLDGVQMKRLRENLLIGVKPVTSQHAKNLVAE